MEWSVERFKSAARKSLRNNFITMVFITFVVAFVTSEGQNSVALIRHYDSTVKQAANVVNYARKITDAEVLQQLIKDLFQREDEAVENAALLDELMDMASSFVIETLDSIIPENTTMLGIYSASREMYVDGEFVSGMGILTSRIFTLLFGILAGNLLIVGKRRYFWDAGAGKKVKYPVFTLFHVFRKGHYANCVRIMLLKDIYQILWTFTIVGGFIKCYEYRAIPYLLADNPELKAKEAFRLSKEMMRGYKKKAFLLDLSYLPWNIVGVLTLGFAGVFFVNPYYYAVQAEAFHCICGTYKEKMPGPALSCEGASALRPVEAEREAAAAMELEEAGFEWHLPSAGKLKSVMEKYDPFRRYDVPTLIMLFFSFCVIGWVWEVILHIIQTGDFVKRGVLDGPWLPIYGFGGVLVLILLRRMLKKPIWTFFTMLLLFGVMEYFTSFMLELIYGIRWWDYTGYFMNINGRICLEGVLIFAFAGCVVVYFIAPMMGSAFDKIKRKTKTIFGIVLIILFVADILTSISEPNVGKGITAGYMEEMQTQPRTGQE